MLLFWALTYISDLTYKFSTTYLEFSGLAVGAIAGVVGGGHSR